MSDDSTNRLPGEQDVDRDNALISAVKSMSADFQEVKARLEALVKTVNERLYDTKPMWESALAGIAELKAEIAELRSEMREGFQKLDSKLDVLNEDVLTVRAEQRRLGKRVQDLESKAS